MPIVLKRKYTIAGSYTDDQLEILTYLIDLFRISVGDDNPEKNILNKKTSRYTDQDIIRYLDRAMQDINGGQPLTHFTIFDFATNQDNTLIIDGAIVFAMIAEGILQLANQVSYSDSGLSISMFDKSQIYQGWAGFLLQNYMQAKSEFKQGYLGQSQPSIFQGIGSEFGYYW